MNELSTYVPININSSILQELLVFKNDSHMKKNLITLSS